jgi:rfaE bifunctional protein kinase chain/domain
MLKLTKDRAAEILNKCAGKKIAVIGDVMLDRYFWGSVSRISPESPVPVVDLEDETYHLGGAANVANNLKSIGVSPMLFGVLGNDHNGAKFTDIANTLGINPDGLYKDNSRPTTVKTRIIGNNQQICRLDKEVRTSIPDDGEKFIINTLKDAGNLGGIIFEDYNKGTITSSLIIDIIRIARKAGIPIFVDPKFSNFFYYKDVTVFKPNKKEACQALNLELKSPEEVEYAGRLLLDKLGCENVLMTLGRDGMMLFESTGEVNSVPTRARHVADVSGAGDTAIATLAAAYSAGATIQEAATMANYAAGVVCEMPGIVSITKEALLKSIDKNSVTV